MPIIICNICENEFYVKPSHIKLGWGKYCSIECRTKAQFRGKNFLCNVCGKEIYRALSKIKHSQSGNFFCSKKCQTLWRNKYYTEEKSSNWKNGIRVYRQILERSGVTKECIFCKINNPKVLAVHHLDHNRNNNLVSNLVWLCFNCHFLVHHDKKFESEFTKVPNYRKI